MKKHATHLLMCAPMLIVGAVLIATGSGIGVLIPVAGCMLMMWAMMSGMSGHDGADRGREQG